MPDPPKQPQDPAWEAYQAGKQIEAVYHQFRKHQHDEAWNEAGAQAVGMLNRVRRGIQLHEGQDAQGDARWIGLKNSLKEQLSNDNGLALLKWLRPKLKGLNSWYKENYQQKAGNLGQHLAACMQYPKNLVSETKRWGDCPDNFLRWLTLAWFYSKEGPKPNTMQAIKWSRRAAIHIATLNGHPSAEERKASLELTPDQITKAEALIKELLEKYPQANNSR
jgi:hypothetical protein